MKVITILMCTIYSLRAQSGGTTFCARNKLARPSIDHDENIAQLVAKLLNVVSEDLQKHTVSLLKNK